MNAKANLNHSEDYRRVGEALGALIDQRDVSQRQLGIVTGIAQSTISHMVAGHPFELGNLFALLKVLDKEIGDFFVDAGFTDLESQYEDYTFTIKIRAKSVKHASTSATGRGIQRVR